jgi:8-oxo-dGTP pyrophosphatase MutT (NUDIX family)
MIELQATVLSKGMIASVLDSRSPTICRLPALRPAAVLVPLFEHPSGGSTHLWLIQRSEDGGAHSGQVALPGGKPQAGEQDLRETALREAWEELGIPPDKVEVLGILDDYPTITGFKIRPYVGWIPSSLVPAPDPREVARHFAAPLSMFLSRGSRNWVRWAELKRLVRSYEVEGAVVWGATAAILSKFGEMLRRGGA